MSPRASARSAPSGGSVLGPQTLIHRNKVPNPMLAGPAAVSYTIEWGVSEAVVQAAFLIAVALNRGAYERTTGR